MMGSDMDEVSSKIGAQRMATRRQWLAHCSVLAACASLALPQPSRAQANAVAATGAARKLVLVVGDSLSAEYGLTRGSGWVALLEARLAQKKIAARVVNASISGDTTSGGRSRLPQLLRQHRPAVVVLELGGNDALRGLPLNTSRDNLAQMARSAKAVGAKVLVLGMQVPPNYGRQYSDEFFAVFGNVAKAEGTALVPFMLKGVADGPQAAEMFQADRIHPNAAAHPLILDNVWPALEPLLR
jgi:acyl-CoA thioesterase I